MTTILSRAQWIDIRTAIISILDGGYRILDKENNPIEVSYDIDAETRYALRKNLRWVKSIWDDYEETRKELVVKYRGDAPELTKAHPNWGIFVTELNKVLEEKEECEIYQFKESGLKLDKNVIKTAVVEVLEPLFIKE